MRTATTKAPDVRGYYRLQKSVGDGCLAGFDLWLFNAGRQRLPYQVYVWLSPKGVIRRSSRIPSADQRLLRTWSGLEHRLSMRHGSSAGLLTEEQLLELLRECRLAPVETRPEVPAVGEEVACA